MQSRPYRHRLIAYLWKPDLADTLRAAAWVRRESISAMVRAALTAKPAEGPSIVEQGEAALPDWLAAGRPRDYREDAHRG